MLPKKSRKITHRRLFLTIDRLTGYILTNVVTTMSRIWRLLLFVSVCLGGQVTGLAQVNPPVEKPTQASIPGGALSDSARSPVDRPKSLTFTASTDQRFYFFNDTRNADGRRVPVSVYGVRAGFLFPIRHPRNGNGGGLRAAFKAGAGFYFVNQTLDQPGLLPATQVAVTRHLRVVTAFFEPYLFRKKAVEISLPIELGYGHSRYERSNDRSPENEVARGVFVPAGIGVAASYQFPALRWFRPLHWFGFNVLTGYRFTLKKDIPASQINYSGLYVSVGPSFFLENLTADLKYWRRKSRKK